MKTKDDKCHLILSYPEEDADIQIDKSTIKCSEVKKLSGIHIDNKIEFDTHVETICRKVKKTQKSQKSQYTFKNNKLYGAS